MNWRDFLPAYRAQAQRLERTIKERDEARAQRDRLNNTCVMLKELLHTAAHDVQKYDDENAALKAQVEVLVGTVKQLNEENEQLQKAQEMAKIPARPRDSRRKQQANEKS